MRLSGTSNKYIGYILHCRIQSHLRSFDALFLKCLVFQNRLAVAQKSEIWDWWMLVRHIWGIFDLVGFKVICGHSVQFIKMACNSKTAGRRAKWTENLGIGDTSNTFIGCI